MGQAFMREHDVITEEKRSTLAWVYIDVIIVGRCAVWSILIYNSAASYLFLEHGNIVHQTRGSFLIF